MSIGARHPPEPFSIPTSLRMPFMTPSTVQLNLGDALLPALPFHERTGIKLRPVLVILNSGDDDLVVVPITSHSPRGTFDYQIEFWQAAGLAIASTVRIDKTAVIAKPAIT